MHPARTKVICAGRRYGKTVLGGVLAMNTLRQHGKAAWIAPSYKNTRPLWRFARQTTDPLVAAKVMDRSEAERTITTKHGGYFGVYSADNIDAIRGEWFHLVIVDEAARLKQEDVEDAIEPTLADVGGALVLITTPKGKNWFYPRFLAAQADGVDTAAWQAPSVANPNPNIKHAAELARARVPERTYRQEWLAEFVESGGDVFRRVREAATAERQDGAVDGHEYACGVDWAKSTDFSVFTVLDLTTREVVALDRFNQIDYAVQLGRLQALYDRFKPHVVIAERNSMGEPLVEQLQRMGLPVQPFLTTNATKAAAIDALALAFERSEIRIPDDAALINELQAYEVETLPSGLSRYGAPAGMHDDMVVSLALVWQAVGEAGSLFLWGDA